MKKTIITRLLGEPIWTVDFGGEIRKTRARQMPNGDIICGKIYGKTIGYKNGTFPHASYLERWMPRETLFG